MDDVRRIIDHAAASGIQSLSFTGGEPFLFPDKLIALISYAGEAGIPCVRTGTNGFLFTNPDRPDFTAAITRLAEALTATDLYTFWISIDSPVPELHEKMRGLPGVMKGIERALPIFHEHGIYPSANLGITKNILVTGADTDAVGETASVEHFRAGFRAFFSRIIDLGFTIANVCYPMSIGESSDNTLNPVYGAAAEDDLVRFSARERMALFRALRETVPEFRSRIRIFSPRSSLYARELEHGGKRESSRPCRGGADFFFIDARGGDTYPCGYRGKENLGKFWDMDLARPPLSASCRECDWECFRDPSELLGPFHELFSSPLGLLRRLLRDRSLSSLWLNDLRYFQATDFFNGRRPPHYGKLSRFENRSCAIPLR
jgi:MoaA/NifB/PqqE/SkfB family radical SAM enzyme